MQLKYNIPSFRVIAWRIWSKPFYSTDSRVVGNSINTIVFVLLYSASSSNPDVKHYLGINENFQSLAYWYRTHTGLQIGKSKSFYLINHSFEPRLDYTTHSTHTHMLHMPWSPWKMAVLDADHQQHQPANGGKLGGAWEQGYLFPTWGIHRGLYYTSVIIDLTYNSVYECTVPGQYTV